MAFRALTSPMAVTFKLGHRARSLNIFDRSLGTHLVSWGRGREYSRSVGNGRESFLPWPCQLGFFNWLFLACLFEVDWYDGGSSVAWPKPCRILKVMTNILNWTQRQAGIQCSSHSRGLHAVFFGQDCSLEEGKHQESRNKMPISMQCHKSSHSRACWKNHISRAFLNNNSTRLCTFRKNTIS